MGKVISGTTQSTQVPQSAPNSSGTTKAVPTETEKALPQLQNRLILNRFICRLFGRESLDGFRGDEQGQLRSGLNDQKPGLSGQDGRSNYYHHLQGLVGVQPQVAEKLAYYDERIKGYVGEVNKRRPGQEITLLYFQYMAVLFTEIYLERLDNPHSFIKELNDLVDEENKKLPATRTAVRYQPFTPDDITKLAFWMATGSGKTLIMNINILQYQEYARRNKLSINNILLITPNESLSAQHMAELSKSGFLPQQYSEGSAGQFRAIMEKTVTVIEITKLSEKKKGGGVSVDVGAFGPNNLVLVDEGHKGSQGEAWRELRAKAAEKGFTFEYSATFGQIVNGQSNQKRHLELLSEYSRAIILDYSYHFFHADGYGKDYLMLNTAKNTTESTEWMLLGGLLAFYEQCLVYSQSRRDLASYNIEKPLWLFVGNSVTGGEKKKDDPAVLTDIELVVAFIARFLAGPVKYKGMLERLLKNNTGIDDESGQEPFRHHFRYVRSQPHNDGDVGQYLYKDIVRLVFLAQAGDRLRAVELKNAQGEIGLRVGAENPYFGVINVGDSSKLLDILIAHGVESAATRILPEEDHLTGSLFARIGDVTSGVTMLIGSRKFIEGWDNFRVSSLGLMNLGRAEGSQIIQLFGRGVRLRGWGNSLKRSTRLGNITDSTRPVSPQYIELLETLNVVGIKADYMQAFLEDLKNEGIETDLETIFIPARATNAAYLTRGLLIIGQKDNASFTKSNEVVIIESTPVSPKVKLAIDIRVSFGSIASSTERERAANPSTGGVNGPLGSLGSTEGKAQDHDRSGVLKEILSLLDWDDIYFEMLTWKRHRGYTNLVFTRQTLRDLMKNLDYTLYCPQGYLPPASFGELQKVEKLVGLFLTKYIDAVYTRQHSRWQKGRVALVPLHSAHPNFLVEGGVITEDTDTQAKYVVVAKRAFAERIRELLSQGDELYTKDSGHLDGFPTIHYSQHLYQPLLLKRSGSAWGIERCSPPLLNEGEEKFVMDLRSFLAQSQFTTSGAATANAKDAVSVKTIKSADVFLLRNLSNTGVGFYDPERSSHVYPDFILWILGDINNEQHQWLTFVDPHGLVYSGNFNDPKIRLYSELQSLEAEMQPPGASGQPPCQVHLNSFVIHPSHTTTKDYDALKDSFGNGLHTKGEFLNHNVLFQADGNYVETLLQQIMSRQKISHKGIPQFRPEPAKRYRSEIGPPE